MSDLAIVQETFDSLDKRWLDLLPDSSNNTIFTNPIWQRLWWDEFGAGYQLLLFSLQKNGMLSAIAPLKIKDGHLSFIGCPDLCDYMDFVVRKGPEAEAYASLTHHLLELDWQTLSLSGVAARSPTYQYLPDLLREHGLTVEVGIEDVCPTVELPSNWEEYLSSLRKKDRHELRRKMRRLYNAGDARYYVADDPDLFSNDLEDFLSLLVKSRADKAQFLTTEVKGFFQSTVSRLAKEGYVKLLFLELGGRRVSSAICFDYNDSFLLYNSGYDDTYSSLSVGLLLKAFCLKEAIAMGKKSFDFLRGTEPYKYHLGAIEQPVYTISASR